MIKVLDYDPNLKPKTLCKLYADTKDEVGTASITGLPQGVEADTGSIVITAAGDVGFLTSTGTWSFVGDSDEVGS